VRFLKSCLPNASLIRSLDRSVKIGLLSHTPEKIIDNLKSSLPAIVKNIKDGWDNIQSLSIKTNSSVSLPIWTCELGDAKGGRWDGMVKSDDASIAGESEEGSDADEANMDSEEQVPAVLAGKGKGGAQSLTGSMFSSEMLSLLSQARDADRKS